MARLGGSTGLARPERTMVGRRGVLAIAAILDCTRAGSRRIDRPGSKSQRDHTASESSADLVEIIDWRFETSVRSTMQ